MIEVGCQSVNDGLSEKATCMEIMKPYMENHVTVLVIVTNIIQYGAIVSLLRSPNGFYPLCSLSVLHSALNLSFN